MEPPTRSPGRARSAAPLLLGALLAAAPARAQGGPPLLTDDPFTPRASHWEINTAISAEGGPEGAAREIPALDLSYGWGSRVALALAGPYRWVERPELARNGFGNPEAGVKYRFADHFHGWALAVAPRAVVPLGRGQAARVDGDSVWAFFLPVEAAHSRGRLELAAEAGAWTGAPELRSVAWGVVLGWIASEKLELLSECNAQGLRPLHPAQLVCGLGGRQDLTEHVGIMAAYEPVMGGSDPERPRYHMFLGVETHVRGGGFWRGARRAFVGK